LLQKFYHYDVLQYAEIIEILRAGSWSVQGDLTDGALITLALKTGLNVQQCNDELPRNDVIPFESDHKFMATLHKDSEGHCIIYLKGAPERILDMCVKERHSDADKPINVDYWQEQIEAIARNDAPAPNYTQ
jgi:magnesium-transporting ATPase (P-type)